MDLLEWNDEVAKTWKEKNVIQKNFDLNKGKRYFTFYDGPPTANGMPHAGHIDNKGYERYNSKI